MFILLSSIKPARQSPTTFVFGIWYKQFSKGAWDTVKVGYPRNSNRSPAKISNICTSPARRWGPLDFNKLSRRTPAHPNAHPHTPLPSQHVFASVFDRPGTHPMARPEPYICLRIWQISDKMSEYQNVPNKMPQRLYMSIRIYVRQNVRQNASQNVRIYASYKNYNVLYGKLFHDVSIFFHSTFLGLEFWEKRIVIL